MQKIPAALIKSELFEICTKTILTNTESLTFNQRLKRTVNYWQLAAKRLNKCGNFCIKSGQLVSHIQEQIKIQANG
jgi:hypothetical protein